MVRKSSMHRKAFNQRTLYLSNKSWRLLTTKLVHFRKEIKFFIGIQAAQLNLFFSGLNRNRACLWRKRFFPALIRYLMGCQSKF